MCRRDARIVDRRARRKRERDDAGPARPSRVLVVVERVTGTHLRGGLVDREREDRRRGDLLVVRRACLARTSLRDVLDNGLQRRDLFVTIRDDRRVPEHDGRAVVHRVMERRARHHQTVDDRRRHAGGRAAGERLQHSARDGAVHVQPVADARVNGRDDERLLVEGEADVDDQRLVEDRVNRRFVVAGSRRNAAHGSTGRRFHRREHARRLVHRTDPDSTN